MPTLYGNPVEKWISESFWPEFKEGVKNWWYMNTGRSYLTPDAQHKEKREDTSVQRGALDTESAGLSKYGGVSGAESSGGSNGLSMLDAIQQMQQIKMNTLQLKEARYNYSMSRKLGLRTGDNNELSKYSMLLKVLLGFDVGDVQGDHGVLGMIFPGLFSNSSGGSNGSIFGAVGDFFNRLFGSPTVSSRGLNVPDTYDRSRVAHQVVTGQASLEDFNSAFTKVAFIGLDSIGDGKYQLNDRGKSILKGISLMTSTSPSDVMNYFQHFYWDMRRRFKENDELPSSTLPAAAGGGGFAW